MKRKISIVIVIAMLMSFKTLQKKAVRAKKVLAFAKDLC